VLYFRHIPTEGLTMLTDESRRFRREALRMGMRYAAFNELLSDVGV